MKKFLLPLVLVSLITAAKAQNWQQDMYDPHVNFYTVQREFNDWWAVNKKEILTDAAKGEKGEKEHGEAWRIYKRWEHDVAPMMMSRHGERMGAYDPAEASYYASRRTHSNLRSGSGTWTYFGSQSSFDDGGGDSSTGRVNCVRFDPINPSVIYCGAPSGGLWKSLDFGHSWNLLNTDNLPQIGVSDIAINPINPNTIYIATGDIANSATFSVGVLKSTDGGMTWDTTGLNWTVAQGYLIGRLLMNPMDSNTLIAATNAGVYLTHDGGHTWSADSSIYGLTGMEYNPLNPNVIYTCGTQLYKSFDGGATWHQLTGGLPGAATSGGFAIGLTPADTSCIYVLVSGTTGTGAYQSFNGIYRSVNGGSSFTLQTATPDPSNTGTQGQYDLVLAVSPANRDQLVMAAVENAHSSDGGLTWTSPTFDSHVDHHDMRFYGTSGDTVFSADDGGLFISTDQGNTWAGLNNGMHIGELYNISSSTQSPYDLTLTGRQDEGTLQQDTTYESLLFGGDGLQCLIDPTNPNNLFGSSEYGFIVYSQDGGNTGNALCYNQGSSGVDGQGSWNTPYALDPANTHTIYVAKDYIYKTSDYGTTWTTLNSPALNSGIPYDADYLLMNIAPSNNQYIYAGTYNNLYRTTDGGATFTDITAGLDTPFFCMDVSPDDPQKIWVGTTMGHVFKSIDAGTTWIDYSQGLPVGTNFSPSALAAVKGSADAVYTGLYYAGGVFYRDSTMATWAPFSGGLPNVSVNQIELDYCAGKVRAATYGRDVWESDPYVPLYTSPKASAIDTVAAVTSCTRTIQFTDQSYYCPTSWQWSFPGGNPATSASPNPAVVYNDNGNTYTAKLIVSNASGSDTATYSIRTGYCTGISSLSADSRIQIIPNPNNGSFTISLDNDMRGTVTFTVYDDMGQSMYRFSAEKDEDAMSKGFSLTGLSSGLYYVRVTSGDTSSMEKLVVGN
jgi:photosystem II stability/assembly factor-like uncharacterized protein